MTPVFPPDECEEFDLAHVFSGGRVVSTSDQHYGVGSNLIIPGRGASITDRTEVLYAITVLSFTPWSAQERTWATVGKPNAVASQITKIGSSSNCESPFLTIEVVAPPDPS